MSENKQQKFIRLWATSGKSLESVADEVKIEMKTATEWTEKFAEEITAAKVEAFDAIMEANQLTDLPRFTHLCQLYARLRTELDKRDFSGLPTDKLYYIMDDVFELITSIKDNQKQNSK